MGFTCILYNSNDWLSIIYASFGVLGIEWYMYVSFGIQEIKNFGWISGFSKKQPLCSTSTLIHIKKSIEPQITG
jgi:hypothetical protein